MSHGQTKIAETKIPQAVLDAYDIADASFRIISSGHINKTWRVQKDSADGVLRFALQRLNPIFDPVLHKDIDALLPHVRKAGLQSPQLIPALDGSLYVGQQGAVWRLLSWIDGESVLQCDSPQRSAAAGLHLGKFHAALWNVKHEFHFRRAGVHDTKKHLENLREALQKNAKHDYIHEVTKISEKIMQGLDGMAPDLELPLRMVHGDPKISNFVFARGGEQALCLVDLDTLGKMPLALELGDAFRSWANPRGEEPGAHFVPEHFAAGFAAYLRGLLGTETETVGTETDTVSPLSGPTRLRAVELRILPESIERICLELAARFAADALNENYFAWDHTRFSRSAAHNLQRARAQLGLAASIHSQRAALQALVDQQLKKWKID